tara:strand:- start:3637 stop:4044 length:408 start_codon:yes stop_codon:yes gene_type:complete
MKLAILIPWNKTLGYDNDEDLNVLEKKAMVIAKYPNEDDQMNINELFIMYNSMLNMDTNDGNKAPVFLAFIKNSYIENEREFANISYHAMNILNDYINRIRYKNKNLSNKWSQKFRQIRGRLPTKKEFIKHDLVN